MPPEPQSSVEAVQGAGFCLSTGAAPIPATASSKVFQHSGSARSATTVFPGSSPVPPTALRIAGEPA